MSSTIDRDAPAGAGARGNAARRTAGAVVERRRVAAGGEPSAATAFRNFGRAGAASAGELYSGLATPADTQAMLARLMRRMAKPFVYGDGVSSADAAANQSHIPAGYTYLAQFVGHDLVHNSAPLTGLDRRETDHRNMQASALRLHTLYGDGPSVNCASYEGPRAGERFRTRLRTGPVAPAAEPWTHPFRDIPRARQSDLSDPAPFGSGVGRPDVLVADQRNDANAVIAQITALFHHIHNVVADEVLALPARRRAASPVLQDSQPFQTARRVTTALYRRIVRDDLLPRLVHPGIWERYAANGFAPLVERDAGGMPLEFSHAACRLGHAMVRLSYRFSSGNPPEGLRDVLRNVSSGRPDRFPPEARWIAAWSNFFELTSEPPQRSRRIGPSLNPVLMAADVFQPPVTGDGAPSPHPDCSGLLFRDLIRGTVGGLLKLDGLLAALPEEVRASTPLLASAAGRRKTLRDWLAETDIVFSQAELDHLSADPPLHFWLLFEAATEADGMSFGTLGSLIFADVLLARLAPALEDAGTDELIADLFPGHRLNSMPDLIDLTADRLGLREATPPFI